MSAGQVILTLLWSGSALVALGFHLAATRAAQLDKDALGIRGLNGRLKIVAGMRIRSEVSRGLMMLLLVLVGVAVYVLPRGYAGWALLPLPFIGLVSSLLDLRDRRRLELVEDAPHHRHQE